MKKHVNNEMVLVLGGARSGKSSWALKYAEEHYASCLFLATAEVTDEEMEDRIRLHKEARGPRWRLVEEPVNIAEALEQKCEGADVVLIDCMTIWQSNILMKTGAEKVPIYREKLLEVLLKRERSVILVSNEVGAGIVPLHPLARQFRDLAGTLNQELAALADKVVMTVAGIPLFIK
jgi:adenosylcobinamide kinase/adenosylcobinamide-phosphate guanylyltransferase